MGSKLEDLISKKCPNGVEYKPIGEIAEITDYVANGSFKSIADNVTYKKTEDYAVLIRLADYSAGFDKEKFIYIDEHAYNFLSKSKLFGGEIIMSNVGSVGTLFRCPTLDKPMSLAPNTIVIKTENNDFYYHYLQTAEVQQQIKKITSKSAMPKFNKTEFRKILVPVPPIEVQNEIVRILDTFTELTAELTARQQQYEYYRNKLLCFDDSAETLGAVHTHTHTGISMNKK